MLGIHCLYMAAVAAGREQKKQFIPVHGRNWEPGLGCALGCFGIFRPDLGIFHPRAAAALSQLSSHSPSLHGGIFFWLGEVAKTEGREARDKHSAGRQKAGKCPSGKGENNIHLVVKQSLQGGLLSLRIIKQVKIPEPSASRRCRVGVQSWDPTKTRQEKEGHLLWDM